MAAVIAFDDTQYVIVFLGSFVVAFGLALFWRNLK